MKVDAPLVNPALPRSSTGLGQPSTSFAEVLASGRSAESIRSERAFGFGETGLLGAARFSTTSTARFTASTSGNVLPSFAPRHQTSEAWTVAGMHAPMPSVTKTSSPSSAGPGRPVAATPTNSLSASPQGIAELWSQTNSQPSSGQPAGRGGKAPFGAPLAPPRPDQRRRKLTVHGADDDIAVNIRLNEDEEVNGEYLLSRFYPICREFGVTLSAVQIFECKAESAFRGNGDKQCR